MSKDKAEEKAKAIQARTERLKLISKIPLIKSNILYIAESGSINGSLMLSIEKLMDNYTESLSTENAQLREALRELVKSIDDYTYYSDTSTIEEEQSDINLSDALYKAKQLLTDKE